MEDSTDNPSINMILFPTRTIPDSEIIQTYAIWEPNSTRQSKPTVPSPWISIPTELSSETAPSIHKFNVMGSSSSDDLREMMKTLASNTVTLQQNIMSFQQETRWCGPAQKHQQGPITCSKWTNDSVQDRHWKTHWMHWFWRFPPSQNWKVHWNIKRRS